MKQGTILRTAHSRIKERNHSFSLRAAALQLGLSPQFLHRVVTDKTPLPVDRLADFVRVFKLDSIETKNLKHSLLKGSVKSTAILEMIPSDAGTTAADYQSLGEASLSLLEKWFYLPLLDLADCKGFKAEPAWIARKLGISISEAKEAMHKLLTEGWLKQTPHGRYEKTIRNIRFPTVRSMTRIRSFHQQLIRKGLTLMASKTSQVDFERRLITGVTFTANTAKLQKAKEILFSALYEVEKLMNDGDGEEVYQVTGMLFPLTESDDR